MELFPVYPEGEEYPPGIPHTPFYAGFGNRPNDAKAYRAVHIPPKRIFIINPRAEVRVEKGSYKSTYDTLAENIDMFFPSYSCSHRQDNHGYNHFEFWNPRPEP